MDGMLSQDEINALLSGLDTSGDMSGGSSAGDSGSTVSLSDVEKDAIGEVANISMGTSATTLYSLVNRKVNITTPIVSLATWDNVVAGYERPCVFIQIKYTTGLDGTNILVLKEQDVLVITDLMMGGDGTNIDAELGDLHLSAISEAMNQMMGSAATSLSSMLGTMIDISPPEASVVDFNFKRADEIADFLTRDFVKIEFRMQIDDLVDSSIMQLYPIDFAKSLYTTFMDTQADEGPPAPPPVETAPQQQAPAYPPIDNSMSQMGMPPQMGMPQMGMSPQMGMPQMGMSPQMGMPQMGMTPQTSPMGMPQNMNIQTAQFQSFSNDYAAMQSQENIGLIMDVPLEVTVELGRTKKLISEILDFAPGIVIELDKIAGEPVDVLVNGKFVARGEVVVIDENFGIRITEIIK